MEKKRYYGFGKHFREVIAELVVVGGVEGSHVFDEDEAPWETEVQQSERFGVVDDIVAVPTPWIFTLFHLSVVVVRQFPYRASLLANLYRFSGVLSHDFFLCSVL